MPKVFGFNINTTWTAREASCTCARYSSLFLRNDSRTRRFTLLRTVAFPARRVIAMPIIMLPPVLPRSNRTIARKVSPSTRCPREYISLKTFLPRKISFLFSFCAKPFPLVGGEQLTTSHHSLSISFALLLGGERVLFDRLWISFVHEIRVYSSVFGCWVEMFFSW